MLSATFDDWGGLPNNNKHNLLVFYKRWKKYNERQLTKNKMELNNRKMTNHPPSPVFLWLPISV